MLKSLFGFGLLIASLLLTVNNLEANPNEESKAQASKKAPAGDSVVATVNGQKIYKSQLEQSYQQHQLFLSYKRMEREQVLDEMIHRLLGIEKAKKGQLDRDDLVKSKMEDVLYHAQVSKDLEPLFKKIAVTDKEVEQYYKDHKEYRTAHILLRLRALPSDEEREAAYKQILKLYETVKADPTKFGELANQYTQATTAPLGGDLGFQPASKLAPEYFAAIKNKPLNHITPPIRTQFGFHIAKVLGVKDFKDVNKGYYKKVVYDQKRDKIIEDYFASLKKEASIVVNKDLLE